MKRYPDQGAAYAALLFCLTPMSHAYSTMDDFSLYFHADSFIHSETVPIKSALNDWKGLDFQRGKRQWTHNWAEAGVRYQHLSLGYVTRMDYDLRFSKDLSEIYWQTSNRINFEPGKDYFAQLNVNSFKADGLRFAFHNQYRFISYEIGMSFLNAREFYDGQIVGAIQSLSTKDYDFDLSLDYHYSEDKLFDRSVTKPDGEGHAFDVQFQIDWKDHLFSADIKDISAKIIWHNAPYTTGQANSENNSTDGDGFIVINPTLSGIEGISTKHKQNLKTRSHIRYEYKLNNNLRIGGARKQQYGHALHAGSLTWIADSTYQISYWPQPELIQFSWRKGGFTVTAASDTLSTLNDAKTFWLAFGWRTH